MDLTERLIEGGRVFEGKLLEVRRDRVALPDGGEALREYVQHPGACVVIAEVRPGILIFERQFRYPLGQVFIEMPAGKIDQTDSLLGCAQRELLEETGYSASSWQHVGRMHNCIGYSNEKIEIFLARELLPGKPELDEGEFVEVFEMSLDEAEQAVLDGRITDAKTITCLFWARRLL
ncbi:NUDIX domain-containing protein [Uliginosibacterium sp. 31-12]|uniref:NUDIX domain-containing protein n=1 Tax=Uliginosibacterium sp. 31-12 TaxID=3062781 RepID=UPI0026E23A8F|nr:NUDIX hydrolase [Uliginosibacterium sp. 31-12]MDO6386825.1 NUDIX hydrolase [Uliginosibacterium sp. 31-12]